MTRARTPSGKGSAMLIIRINSGSQYDTIRYRNSNTASGGASILYLASTPNTSGPFTSELGIRPLQSFRHPHLLIIEYHPQLGVFIFLRDGHAVEDGPHDFGPVYCIFLVAESAAGQHQSCNTCCERCGHKATKSMFFRFEIGWLCWDANILTLKDETGVLPRCVCLLPSLGKTDMNVTTS